LSVSLLVARLLLAGNFAVAGAAKLADRDGFRQTFSEFGVPTPFAAPLPVLLALAELSVAVALFPAATARWGDLEAFALLGLFMTGVSVALARGRKPECHCFGQLHSALAGWMNLAGNSVLATLAGFVVWQGWDGDVGPSVISWLGLSPPLNCKAF
jgi:uncharacterized membrane protein YphA (DoxX/SURF4 family)